jgi:YesN/AraC family two-component response regulator
MVMAITYTILSVRIIYLNVWKRYAENKIDATAQQQLLTKWTTFLIIGVVLVCIRLLLSIIYEAQLNEVIIGYTFTSIQGSLWLIIFLMILVHPEILYGYAKLQRHIQEFKALEKPNEESVWNYTNEPVNNTQDIKLQEVLEDKRTGYFSIIDEFVSLQKPFSNKKYGLKDLAQDLKVPTSHLTFIFKYCCKLSFTEFKNYARVKHALEIMSGDFLDSKTFEAMAEAVGFSTYNTFYITFKAYTGKSPKDFYLREPELS